ncbi:MAG: zinc ribbon domain-containing protein [archaeon]|nr:zinc ribbon domain-containing protein [archaeon]
MANYCPKCGNTVGFDDSFCPKCGARLDSQESEPGTYNNNGYGSGYNTRTFYKDSSEIMHIVLILTGLWVVMSLIGGLFMLFVGIGVNVPMFTMVAGGSSLFYFAAAVLAIIAAVNIEKHTNRVLTLVMLVASGFAASSFLSIVIGCVMAYLVYDARDYFTS